MVVVVVVVVGGVVGILLSYLVRALYLIILIISYKSNFPACFLASASQRVMDFLRLVN